MAGGFTIVIPNTYTFTGSKQELSSIIPSPGAPGVDVDGTRYRNTDITTRNKNWNKYLPGGLSENPKPGGKNNYATLTFNRAGDYSNGDYVGTYVRRPLSGLAIKPNTHATISVLNSMGNEELVFNELGSTTIRNTAGGLITSEITKEGGLLPSAELFGESTGYDDYDSGDMVPEGSVAFGVPKIDETQLKQPQSKVWTDWFLQSVTEQRQEKIQITETFDHTIFSAFGQRPRFLIMKGFLLNSSDFPWRAQFWHNWDKYFRATSLVQSGSRIQLHWDDIVVQGYPINAVAKQNAKNPHMIGFQFTFLVTSYMNMTMENVGQLQRMQFAQVASSEVSLNMSPGYSHRNTEFAGDNAFSYQMATNRALKDADLIKALGGEQLAFMEFHKNLWGGMLGTNLPYGPYGTALGGGVGGAATYYDLLFGSGTRYVKGGRTAREMLVNFINKTAQQFAWAGAEMLAASTTGGMTTLNYFAGALNQLYEMGIFKAMNAFQKGGYKEIGRTITGAPLYSVQESWDIGTMGYEGHMKRQELLYESSRMNDPTSDVEDRYRSNRWADFGLELMQQNSLYKLTNYLGYAAGNLVWSGLNEIDYYQYDQGTISTPGLGYAQSTQIAPETTDYTTKTNHNLDFSNKVAAVGAVNMLGDKVWTGLNPEYGPAGPNSPYNLSVEAVGAAGGLPWWSADPGADDYDPKHYAAKPDHYKWNPLDPEDPEGPGQWEFTYDFTGTYGETGGVGSNAVKSLEQQKADMDAAKALQDSGEWSGQYNKGKGKGGKANHGFGGKITEDMDDDGSDPKLDTGPDGSDPEEDFPGWDFEAAKGKNDEVDEDE